MTVSRLVLRDGVQEKDVAEVIRQTRPSVKAIVDGIEPKSDAGVVLDELKRKKTDLMKQVGDVDPIGILHALMDKQNTNPEAVKIRRLFEHLWGEKAVWWSSRVLEPSVVNQIVIEELEIGILEAIRGGADFTRYVMKDAVGDITVRRAGKKDVPDIINLFTMGLREKYGLELPKGKADAIGLEYGLYYLGFFDGTLAGMMALDPCHDVAWRDAGGNVNVVHDTAYVRDEFTLPTYRNSEVSETLHNQIIEDARRRGLREVYEAPKAETVLKKRLEQGFRVCGACLTCAMGPRCGWTVIKKELRK